MKKFKKRLSVATIFISVILLTLYALSQSDGSIHNIQGDLNGKKVNSTNNKYEWQFKQDQPLKFVILKKRSSGTNKNKNVFITLLVQSRQNSANDSIYRAEGTIELRYTTNLSSNNLYLDGITPIDFRIISMTKDENLIYDELDLFWEEFQIAVINEYKEKISSMINYPLTGKYFQTCNNKSELFQNFKTIFSDDVRAAVKNSILSAIPKPKGKEFSIYKDEFIQTIDLTHQIEKDNFTYQIVVKRIDNKFKVIRFQENMK